MASCTILLLIYYIQNVETRDTMVPPSTSLCTHISIVEVCMIMQKKPAGVLEGNPSLVNRINSIVAKRMLK